MERVLSEEGIKRARERYQRAESRKRKSALLTEFCELTGCHRKHATRVLGRQRAGGLHMRGVGDRNLGITRQSFCGS